MLENVLDLPCGVVQYPGYKRVSYCFCQTVVFIAVINIEELTISASRRSQPSMTFDDCACGLQVGIT